MCHEGPLLRYAYSLTGDLETAQDVVQDTFLKLCEQSRKAVVPHLVPWLFTVCRNRALDVMRKSRRMTELSDDEMARQVGDGPAPDQQASMRDSSAVVLKLLESLPMNQREVIRLKFQSHSVIKKSPPSPN